MKIKTLAVIILLFTISMGAFSPDLVKSKDSEKNYIIEVDGSESPNWIQRKNWKMVYSLENSILYEAKLTIEELNVLQSKADINLIEQDGEVKLKTISKSDKGQSTNWGYEYLSIEDFKSNGISGNGIKIAILDTGINTNHQDLTHTKGKSFTARANNYNDENGHGSQVAGIISASDNEEGILGVAPQSKLYIGKVLDEDGVGKISNIIEGISWAVSNNVDIISMSFGTKTNYKSLEKSIKEANKHGVTFVSAAGNSQSSDIDYPARYKNVISVGALNENIEVPQFSNYGKNLDLVAPGVNILSTHLNDYKSVSGTSIAVPFVVGSIALILEKKPSLEGKDIEKILKNNTTFSNTPLKDGEGVINPTQVIQSFK